MRPIAICSGTRRRVSAALLLLLLVCQSSAWADDSKLVRPFTLEPIRAGEPLVSSAYPGAILVLDFFAPWCVSCVDVTHRVDQEVKAYYAKQTEGLPVVVAAVNIDQRRPRLIERFLERAELENAFNDPEGALFEQLLGEGVPFLVVLTPEDATRSRRVFYQQLGMEDSASLKKAIELLRAEEARLLSPVGDDPPLPAVDALSGPTPVSFRLDDAAEYMASDDVWLLTNDLQLEMQAGSLRFTQLLSLGWIGVDYEPSSKTFFGERSELKESNWTYALTTAWVGAQNTLSLTGGLGEGLQDYRSVWLAEFYRQGFESDPVYSEPDPSSAFLSAEFSRLLYHDQLRLSLDSSYREDTVAPPYERVIPSNPGQAIFTQVGREQLQTTSLGVEADWIATERMRAQTRLSIDDTTGRELRWAGEFTLKYVLADSWVASLRGTHVSEGEAFSAWSVAGDLDYDLDETWFFGLSLRYYQDNGLVRDPAIISADSPALDTFQAGVRVARVFGRASLSFALYHYRSTYDELGAGSFEYENLYRDRDWVQARFACSFEF